MSLLYEVGTTILMPSSGFEKKEKKLIRIIKGARFLGTWSWKTRFQMLSILLLLRI